MYCILNDKQFILNEVGVGLRISETGKGTRTPKEGAPSLLFGQFAWKMKMKEIGCNCGTDGGGVAGGGACTTPQNPPIFFS